MATRTGRLGNICFKKESTYDTYIAGDIYLRATSENIARQVGFAEDSALVSQIYTTDMVRASEMNAGPVETSMHPDTFGPLCFGVLGGEAAVADPVAAWVLLSYNGAATYQRFTKSSNNLVSETSADGSSWTGDAAFGTAGTLDLSSASADTLAEMVALISGYTGYDAALFGSGTVSSTTLVDFTATATKSASEIIGAYLCKATVAAATASKLHTITPAAASVELPSWSFTINRVLGTNKSVAYTGAKIQSLAIANTAGEICKLSAQIIACKEVEDKNDITLAVPEQQPFIASKMIVAAVDASGNIVNLSDVTDISMTINANLDQSKVVGSYYITEPTRQKATMDISFTAFNTATSYALRTAKTSGQHIQLFVYFLSNENIESGVPYSVMLRFPAIQLTDYNSTLGTPDRMTIAATATVVKPKNTTYTNHVYAYVVDNDLTTY